jgi:hypothetical protein
MGHGGPEQVVGGEVGCDFYAVIFDGCAAMSVDMAGFDG